MTTKCIDCAKRTMASSGRCLFCQVKVRRLARLADASGWTVDQAGGGWWVWDARGEVLGMGDRRAQALAAALGDET